jgi:beta-alanine--pyruvate transaminase
MHGYTYSGHPLASAAALATIDLHIREDLPGRVREIEPYWEEAVHSMKSASNVVDIRNHGLIAGIELSPRAGKPGERAMAVFRRCFDDGLLVRVTGDIVALSPPLIIEKHHVDRIVTTLGDAIHKEAA